jgi:kynurenine 3-monooxygenase
MSEPWSFHKVDIAVVGAGLVGSLLALGLKRRGFDVAVFERRPDPRTSGVIGGRSINLALSDRGLLGLASAGVLGDVEQVAVSMPGRRMHARDGSTTYMPYGLHGEAIRSVSRGGLNQTLIGLCRAADIPLFFDAACLDVELATGKATFERKDGSRVLVEAGLIAGADGAFSAARRPFLRTDRFDYRQDYLAHGYKELTIPAGPGGSFLMEKNALHIWPRQSYMLIALPNLDGSFTCTLFLAFDDGVDPGHAGASFSGLSTAALARTFFAEHFRDALELMPDFEAQWSSNTVSSLSTVRCFPWVRGRTFLIGDAAHAIVPFFGQGMNAGFEDCRVLFEALDAGGVFTVEALQALLPSWQMSRKPDADGIAELALQNFVEMRDKVGSPAFLFRKSVEAAFARACPDTVTPAYTMVTFRPRLGYAEALRKSQDLDGVLDALCVDADVAAYVKGDTDKSDAARRRFEQAAALLR